MKGRRTKGHAIENSRHFEEEALIDLGFPFLYFSMDFL
jgi:hypothetical protein